METKLEQKAWEAIRRFDMLHRGDSIAVGVSGGADSVALFDFLCSIRREWELTLTVCHVNHNLRGEESLRDQEFVRELAGERQVPFRLLSVDAAALAGEQGKGIEEASRELRYRFFAQVAGPLGKIATAHTLDDSGETFLFRLARGSGPRGLRGIPPVRENVIRPLIGCSRRDVEEYLHTMGLPWMEDSTNREDMYARNRIRHHVMPALCEINPQVLEALAGAMERIDDLQALAGQMARQSLPKIRLTEGEWDAAGVLALPRAVGNYLLLEMLEKAGLPPDSRRIEQMRQTLLRGGEADIGGGLIFRCCRGRARLEPKPQKPVPIQVEISLERDTLPRSISLGDGRKLEFTLVSGKELRNPEKINKRDLNSLADYAKISNTAILRQKQDGDRIALPQRGRRLLKKLYQEAGIPPHRRAALLVLCDRDGPFWAEKFGFDRRVVSLDAEEYLTVTVLEEAENGTYHA